MSKVNKLFGIIIVAVLFTQLLSLNYFYYSPDDIATKEFNNKRTNDPIGEKSMNPVVENYLELQDSEEEINRNHINRTSERSFSYIDTSSNDTITVDNCNDWTLDTQMNFSNIRSEKITNGGAESTEELWTDYIPSDYEGNVTRENNPPLGTVITGDYSWYFNITSNDYTTIVGFDDDINVSSDSVIFSLSYSLLRNSLGTSYDSNICIRLFFQFHIYLFIWFDGNEALLTNVTGPGGSADLLVSGSDFNSEIEQYTLNVTALGLDLFNQKPDKLRSMAIQTWGETPYEMEFMIDDISLTDQISPTDINMKANSKAITGGIGWGTVDFTSIGSSQAVFSITHSSSEKVYWDCNYKIAGFGSTATKLTSFFYNWDTIIWNETFTVNYSVPDQTQLIDITQYIPVGWTISEVIVNSVSIDFTLLSFNDSHNKLTFEIDTNQNSIQIKSCSHNFMSSATLLSNIVSHNDLLEITIESELPNKLIFIEIWDSNNAICFIQNSTQTNSGGSAILYQKLDNEMPRTSYYINIFWISNNDAGFGKVFFDISTYPAEILTENQQIDINFQESFTVEVDYINLELNITIDFATVSYDWDFGSGYLSQIGLEKYSAQINTQTAIPGMHSLTITAYKNGYAQSFYSIPVNISLNTINLLLTAPDSAIPSDAITLRSRLINNASEPITNCTICFIINNGVQFYYANTNASGYATVSHIIPFDYAYNTLNVSCIANIGETEFNSNKEVINIELYDVERNVNLGLAEHINSHEELSWFAFNVNYPSIGEKWKAEIPNGFNPISGNVVTETYNVSITISPTGFIFWERTVESALITDQLILVLEYPTRNFNTQMSNTAITIEISVYVANVPYNGLEIVIEQQDDWRYFNNWELYQNGTKVTDDCQLEVSSSYFKFKIYSTNQAELLQFEIRGTRESLVKIAPTTILLGVGIVALTTVSTFLLLKKRSKASLEIQY